MFPPEAPWAPELKWASPAGRVLLRLLDFLPPDQQVRITVFGSAPLQLGVDSSFLSADVDVFSSLDLTQSIERADLGPGQNEIYVQQSDELVFRASPSWLTRAFEFRRGQITLVFPHPLDILIAKLPRLEPKDLNAFRLVRDKTGHPTPEELVAALQGCVDLFRPAFDEENSGDPIANTRRLWEELYGYSIDVRAEIIRPALERRRRGYEANVPPYQQSLKEIGDET